MSKPMLVTLPFVMLLLDYWPLNRVSGVRCQASGGETSVAKRSTSNIQHPTHNSQLTTHNSGLPALWRLVLEKVPFFALSVAASILTVVAQQVDIKSTIESPLAIRFDNAMTSCVTYLVQMTWPVNLAVFYPYSFEAHVWQAAGAGVLLLSLTVLAIVAAKRFPYLPVGWLWYLVMLVPVIGLVQVGDQSHADRYTYLPQIGLYLAVVWAGRDLTASWYHRRQLLGATVGVVIAVLGISAWKQTSYWRNSESLWTHALACTPGNFTAYSNMGATLTDLGRFDEAIGYYRKVLELRPDSAGAENDWGKSLMGLGRTAEAIEHLQKAIELDPDCAEAHNNLGNLLASQGRVADAIEHYQKAMTLRPHRAEIHNNFGNLLAAQGRSAEAIEHYQKAIELEPDYAKAHYNLANVFAIQGRRDAASAHFQKAVGIKPDYAEAHNDWGAMLLALGRTNEAMQHFQTAIQIKPDFAEAHNNLGSVIAVQGRAAEAIGQFQKAIEIKPDYAKAQHNLANLFAGQGRLDEAGVHYERAAALMPASAQPRYQLALTLQRQGKFALAIAQFQKVLELDPRHVGAQNNLAWVLATCPEASLRNGRLAVELARQLDQLSGGKSPEILDTLAAAYAESGSCGEAIGTAKRALDLATTQNNKLLADAIQARLRLYETNLPYHESP